jgi:hypothetical protein
VVDVTITNVSDAEYLLDNIGNYSLQSDLGLVRVPPHSEIEISVMTREVLPEFELHFRVLNAVTGVGERLELRHTVTPQ